MVELLYALALLVTGAEDKKRRMGISGGYDRYHGLEECIL